METLKITAPKGHEINFDTALGEINFKPSKPKNVMERILSVADAIVELGEADVEVIIYRKLLAAMGPSYHPVAQQEAIIFTKALNEGWVPDWNDSDQLKYYPYFYMSGSSGFRFDDCGRWASYSHVGSRLALKSEALAKHAGTRITEVYKKFMII